MQYNKLGKTDIDVSKICLGTMTWWAQNTEAEAHEQLDYALDHGVNFIDTAELYAIPIDPNTYGLTEQYIGSWLQKTWKRDQVVLATKVAGRWPSHIRDGVGLTPESIMSAIDDSLQRLKTDYVDLYQLHWPQRQVQAWGKINYSDDFYDASRKDADHIHQILKTLDTLQKSGKVRHFWLSNETSWWAMKYLEIAKENNLPRMESIQNAYSIIRREYEVWLAEISLQEDMWLLAYSPLAGGLLSGKYRNNQWPKDGRFTLFGKNNMWYYLNDRSYKAVEDFAALADELWITLTELSLAFVNDRKFVTSNIIGATTIDQLEECIGSADIELSSNTRTKIDEMFTENQNPGNF